MVGDITRPESYEAALAGCTHLVILSSAVPRMQPTANPDDPPVSCAGGSLRVAWCCQGCPAAWEAGAHARRAPRLPNTPLFLPTHLRGPGPAAPPRPQVWGFEPGQEPEAIDWLGQRAQIDLALKHGLRQVVLVSSMGVTQADHPLNRMGKILVSLGRAVGAAGRALRSRLQECRCGEGAGDAEGCPAPPETPPDPRQA